MKIEGNSSQWPDAIVPGMYPRKSIRRSNVYYQATLAETAGRLTREPTFLNQVQYEPGSMREAKKHNKSHQEARFHYNRIRMYVCAYKLFILYPVYYF